MGGRAGIVVFAAALCLSGGHNPIEAQRNARPASVVAKRIIGTWRLVSIEGDSLTRVLNRGAHPTGLLYYDATGHMAVQIMPDRRRPSWPRLVLPTPQQAKEAVTGYLAYFGTYSVDERARTVTHHRQGALDFDVVDYVRRYEFVGNDRLILTLERP